MPEPIAIKNISGGEMPAYAICALQSSPNYDTKSNCYVWDADKPADDSKVLAVNGPNRLADTARGTALLWVDARLVYINPSPGTGLTVNEGDLIGPTVGQWYASRGTGNHQCLQPFTNKMALVSPWVPRRFRGALSTSIAAATDDHTPKSGTFAVKVDYDDGGTNEWATVMSLTVWNYNTANGWATAHPGWAEEIYPGTFVFIPGEC